MFPESVPCVARADCAHGRPLGEIWAGWKTATSGNEPNFLRCRVAALHILWYLRIFVFVLRCLGSCKYLWQAVFTAVGCAAATEWCIQCIQCIHCIQDPNLTPKYREVGFEKWPGRGTYSNEIVDEVKRNWSCHSSLCKHNIIDNNDFQKLNCNYSCPSTNLVNVMLQQWHVE